MNASIIGDRKLAEKRIELCIQTEEKPQPFGWWETARPPRGRLHEQRLELAGRQPGK
jgi:hypothetical protein